VLPFAQVDSNGQVVAAEEDLLIDNIGIVSSKLKQTPADFVQGLVQTELSRASLDVVAPAVIEAGLAHGGYAVPSSKPVKLDLAKILTLNPKEFCSTIASCDAVLLGRVTTWDRSYYGLQTINTVGLKLKLVSARSNKVLFESFAQDSDGRGLSKGPTGFSNLVLEPIKGLDNEIITTLAAQVVKKSLEPLNARKRPEMLASAPPSIIAAAHDAASGVISTGNRLTVVFVGTPGLLGTFSVGSFAIGIPAVERSPGRYIGEFVPLSSDSFRDQLVTVSLQDAVGRITQKELALTKVSYK